MRSIFRLSSVGRSPFFRLINVSEALAVSDEFFADSWVCDGDDVGGEVTGVLAVADADRGHRDSRGHLHDRVQGIDAVERAAGAGQTDNGKNRVPCVVEEVSL